MPDRKLIDECVHCGFCLPACPTYQSWGQEMDSPRGRIYLMKAHSEGRVALSGTIVEHFDRCLGCLACVTACPSGVKYDVLIEQTRAEIERSVPRSFWDRMFRALLFALFPHPVRLRWLGLLQLAYQRSGLRWLLRRAGVFRLLPPRLRQLEALAPSLSWSQLWTRLPAFSPAQGPRRRRVALLPGCVQRVYFPEVNRATQRVLTAEGCDVSVPRGLGCCGALSLHAGRESEAQGFARRAIARLEKEDVDVIVVNAAGCGSAMKHWPRLLAADPQWRPRAEAVAAKVKDITEFLAGLEAVAPRQPLALRLAYHDACHLSHGQGLRAEPRALLRAIPGVELLEIPDPEQCCGSAGVYNLLEPGSAQQIGKRKADHILGLQPEILVTANPGCTLQIRSQLGSAGSSLRTAHPIEVIDASIRGTRI
ncbi:MAG TPA: heterodisulfide reductase-related iron-sulfur binding cluster [Polyangiaceae bacterium]|nr:heterodisulfide reductase-related iron-sulfur binding cluster [Polyangiaceae bacterium]